MTRYSTFDSWAANVKPAPRCGSCDNPLGLGDFSNYNEVQMGEADGYLCLECVVHYDAATRWNGRTECMAHIGTLRTTQVLEETTCCRCLRDYDSRTYHNALSTRDYYLQFMNLDEAEHRISDVDAHLNPDLHRKAKLLLEAQGRVAATKREINRRVFGPDKLDRELLDILGQG